MNFPLPFPRTAASALALACVVALAGCAGAPPPQRMYRLDTAPPRAPAATVPAAAAAAETWVLSSRVVLPEYLQREAIVVADGARLQPLDGERWAEPLRDALPRLLRADLETLRGPGSVWSAPLPAGAAASRTLRIEIAELQADEARRAVRLVARWTLEDAAGTAPPRTGSAAFDEPLDGRSVDALVQAHRRALWRLAERIAAPQRAD